MEFIGTHMISCLLSCVLILTFILTSWVKSACWPGDRACLRFLPLKERIAGRILSFSALNCCKLVVKEETQVLFFLLWYLWHLFCKLEPCAPPPHTHTSSPSGMPCWLSSRLTVFFVLLMLDAGCCCPTLTVICLIKNTCIFLGRTNLLLKMKTLVSLGKRCLWINSCPPQWQWMALSLDRSGWTALKHLWFCRQLRPPQQERDFGGNRSTLQLQGLRVSPFMPSLTCDQPVKPVIKHLLSCPLVSSR